MTYSVTDQLDRIPEEMKWSPQWCISGLDKAPYSVNSHGLYRASVTDPSNWMDFESAVDAAKATGGGVGYVISINDQFTCIDLDVVDAESQAAKGEPIDPTKWTTQDQFNRYWGIVQAFDSYTERSRSGKGLHIWVRGSIGKGCRRDGVEVYSQERFIICTGDVVIDKPIAQRNELLEILVSEIRRGQMQAGELVEVEAQHTDEEVWRRASTAANDHKFTELFAGRWSELGYPSQSEADLSLMSMFCFYSNSNEQCRRMFRASELGKRDKAVKNDVYLNRTIGGIRARQQREAASVDHGAAQAQNILNNVRAESEQVQVHSLVANMQASANAVKMRDSTVPKPSPSVVSMAQLAPMPTVDDAGLPWPPGFAGALAGFIYQSAPRPVKEVAIVAALGLLAGICGKTFSIPQSGLNLYIILVARSAIGKEAMHSGIAALMESLRLRCPRAMSFVDFNDFASGPALSKAVQANTSFVNVAGEWGHKLRRLASDDRMDGPMQQLRTVMTNLYQKSGPASIVGGISYSNKEQNIGSVSGVAYSMIGETTPNTLYESLTESMMEDGFLSRFTIIEYTGDRPAHNHNTLDRPSDALADALAQLADHSMNLLTRQARQEVGRDQASADILGAFDVECDTQINSTKDEAHRQMWNRATLKVLRISALLAVADNYTHPVMQQHHVEWAITVVRKDIAIMGMRISEGDVGVNDTSRERKLLALARDYIKNGVPASYGVPDDMQQQGIVPRKFFQMRASRQAAFSKHRMGSTNALDATIRSLIDSGYLMELNRDKQVEAFGYHGKCYRVLNLDTEYKKS